MKERSTKYDLTTGGILRKLLLVAVPIMGTQFMQMSYNLTDMFWLGRVGEDALAASGTAGMYMWLAMAFVVIGQMGAQIGVSQSFGRGDAKSAKHYAQNAVLLAALLGTLYGIVLIVFQGPLVGFFNIQDAKVARDTEVYLSIVAFGMPFGMVTAAIVGAFNASGNSKTPFQVNAVGLVANMILDPLLIFTFNMGIAGAAIATVTSQVLAFALMAASLRRGKNRPFERFEFFVRPEMTYIRAMLKWSVPIGLESAFFTSMAMVTSRLVAGFGTSAMAVSRVGSQIESLSWLIGGGFGSALTAYMGQNFGAGKWTRIQKGFRMSAWVMLVYGLAISALMYFLAGPLFSIFTQEDGIITMGIVYMHILVFCQVPQCFESVAGSTFKGIGRTLPPSVVSITANIIRVILAYALSATSLGLRGVWWGITLAAVLRGLGALTWYLIEMKKQPKVDSPRQAELCVAVSKG